MNRFPPSLRSAALALAVCATTPFAFGQGIIDKNLGDFRDPVGGRHDRALGRAPSVGGFEAGGDLLQWGPITAQPRLTYRFEHNSDVANEQGVRRSTNLHTVSTGLGLRLTEQWSLDYGLSWQNYTREGFDDSVDHRFSLNGLALLGEWELRASAGYSLDSPTLVDAGRQTRDERFDVGLDASRMLRSQWFWDASLSLDQQDTSGFSRDRSIDFTSWLRHQLTPLMDVSVGGSYGISDVDPGTDFEHARLQGRFGWSPTEKLSFNAQVGRDFRNFEDIDAPQLDNTTFSVGLQYRPVETTTLSLNADRGVGSSIFANQSTEDESYGARLRQRLFGFLFLDVSYREEQTAFIDGTAGNVEQRDDDTETIDVQLSATLLDRFNVRLFFRNTKNATNQNDFAFSSDQSGLEVGVRF